MYIWDSWQPYEKLGKAVHSCDAASGKAKWRSSQASQLMGARFHEKLQNKMERYSMISTSVFHTHIQTCLHIPVYIHINRLAHTIITKLAERKLDINTAVSWQLFQGALVIPKNAQKCAKYRAVKIPAYIIRCLIEH